MEMTNEDYYDKLEKSDLMTGKIIARTRDKKVARSGDVIDHFYCPRCNTTIIPRLVPNKYDSNRLMQVISTNCGICK